MCKEGLKDMPMNAWNTDLKKVLKAQNGQALLLAIFVVLVMSTLLISLIALAGSNKKTSYQQHERLQANYIADAGLEKLMARLKYDKMWRDVHSISSAYADGIISELTVTENYVSGNLEITATGQYGSSRKTLNTLVNIQPAPVFETYRSLILKHCDDAGNITEDIYLPPALINEKDKEIFTTLAQSYGSGHYFSGDVVWGSENLLGINGLYYVEGNVCLNGNYTGRATIVATGDITVTSDLITDNLMHNSLALISYRNINVELSVTETIIHAILWSEGQVNIYSQTKISGTVVTGELNLSGEVLNYQYASDLVEQIPPGLPVITEIIFWKENYSIF